jgi:hypothetical protein
MNATQRKIHPERCPCGHLFKSHEYYSTKCAECPCVLFRSDVDKDQLGQREGLER